MIKWRSAMELVDTHAHLDCAQYGGRLEDVLDRARSRGVAQVICIGASPASAGKAVEIAERFPGVFGVVGIDPHTCGEASDADFDRLAEIIRHERVVGIGEIGLDYYHDRHPRPVQRDVFARQLALAAELGMPVSIHTREAREDTCSILREYAPSLPGGVMHCFSGDRYFAEFCLGLGFYISAAGPLTYPRSEGLRAVFSVLPEERILLETDAPYLAPQPYRGRTNEPAYLVHTAEAVAAARFVDIEKLARSTTENARRLFGLPADDLLKEGDE